MTYLITAAFLLCAIELTANVTTHIRSAIQQKKMIKFYEELSEKQNNYKETIQTLEQTLMMRDAEIEYHKNEINKLKGEIK